MPGRSELRTEEIPELSRSSSPMTKSPCGCLVYFGSSDLNLDERAQSCNGKDLIRVKNSRQSSFRIWLKFKQRDKEVRKKQPS